MKKIYLFLFLVLPIFGFSQSEYFLSVGTYTTGKSEGIYSFSFNQDNLLFAPADTLTAIQPSYLAFSPQGNRLYAVQETADFDANPLPGAVSAFRFDATSGQMSRLNTANCQGNHPCYVSIDRSGKFLFVGNYSSGNLSVHALLPDGKVGKSIQAITHTGSGPNVDRQTSPHVHAAMFHPYASQVFVPDLGADKVFIYDFNATLGTLSPSTPASIAIFPGGGPRHMDYHPTLPLVYVLEELTGFISVFKKSDKGYTLETRISSLPKGYSGAIGCADIHISPDGKHLYSTNRGDGNTIAAFRIDEKTGIPTLIETYSTQGKKPRNFTLTPNGKFVLVANQETDNIAIFARDEKTGSLTFTGKMIFVPTPVCLVWTKKR